MEGSERGRLTSVKRSFVRHPAFIAAGAAAVIGLLAANALAFFRGMESPYLLGVVILTDMLVIGSGILIAAREVLTAEAGTARAQAALESSEARLGAIVDSAMDAILTVDGEQRVVLFNRAAEQLFLCTRAEAIGSPLDRFIPERFRAGHRGHVQHFGRTGVTSRRMGDVTTLWALRSDGHEFPIEASISQVSEGGQRYYTVILRDISLRKQVEAEAERVRHALDEAQARLAAIVDSAMDAVITVDEEQKIVLFNRSAEQVFGVPRERMLGTPLDRLLPERFRGAHHGHVAQFGRTGVTSRRMGDVTTLWALRPESGEEFPIEASISQVTEAGRRYFTVILRDITVRKQAEDALRRSQQELRALSARVLEAREEEKARIARELHDELGQLLTALKMDFAALKEKAGAPALEGEFAEIGKLLDQTVAATRRISADLRPMMLDDLGLADAAAWLVEDFGRRSGLRCEIRFTPEGPIEEVSKPVSVAIYRAVQESLTNIARHAQAKSAWVQFTVEDGQIHVEIEDDGRGISPEDLAKVRSLGLKGMRERLSFLGGSLEISRAPRGGTRLRLRVPRQGLAEELAA